jgi:hypothetical protein
VVFRDLLDRIRQACEQVTQRARSVRIDPERLEDLAARLSREDPPDEADPARRNLGDQHVTLAYVLTLDAINFGSGWFPKLRKRPGLSGYFTIAASLEQRVAARGPWSPRELRTMTPQQCSEVFGQVGAGPEAAELMALFARALRDLGGWLLDRHGGRFEAPVEKARGSAARLVALLGEMPLYRDVARYDDLEVPFFKRAQLTAADLSAALRGRGLGRFHDLDRLTMFADNLVPHVLRHEGVIVYAPQLAEHIAAGELIPAGSPEEVEIRAVALHAVERCRAACARRGVHRSAHQLDFVLWNRGQKPEIKAQPRHRTRTPCY